MTLLATPHHHLTKTELEAIQSFVHKVERRFPDRLLSILLFGSRARGDAGPDSDMDLLVVLDNPDLETRRMIRDLAVEVWLTYGIYLSTRVWSEVDRRRHADLQSAFYHNLQRDAIHVFTSAIAR